SGGVRSSRPAPGGGGSEEKKPGGGWRKKALRGCAGMRRRIVKSVRRAAATTGRCLQELRGRCGRRICGEAADLPLQSHLSQAGSADDLIAGDVVGLEYAGVDVA